MKQRITIQDPASLKWKPAEVKESLNGTPRSYAVTTTTGRELRRNRSHKREAHQEDRAVEPDVSLHSYPISNPLRNKTTISPDTHTTSSSRLIKTPREDGPEKADLNQVVI